jgi:hypothetical protein
MNGHAWRTRVRRQPLRRLANGQRFSPATTLAQSASKSVTPRWSSTPTG